MIREKKTISGRLLEVDYYPVNRAGHRVPHNIPPPKSKAEIAAQQKYEKKRREKKFIRIINTNFGKDDYCYPLHGHPLYDEESIFNVASMTDKQAEKCLYTESTIDNYYLYCNIYATDFEPESEVRGIFHIKCKLVSKWGWFNDIAYEFYGQRNAGLTSSQIRDLPFDFHQPNVTEYRLENRAILDSDIKIVFETANDSTVDSPSITIAGAAYRINAQLTANYKIIIDPIGRTITRINKTTGMEESVFRLRDTSSSVFAKVPSGIHKVTVAENVKATVTLLQERMTPLWT